MYEQDDTPIYRRLILIGVAAVLVIAIIWVVVWLVFFRSTVSAPSSHRPATSQGQSAKSGNSAGQKAAKSPGSKAPGSSANGQINAPGQSATTAPSSKTPSNLANTGPGNVLLPAAAAVVAGTALSYVRQRKKLNPGA